MLGDVFERFVEKSPISVMVRATLERVLGADRLDLWYERTAEKQYTRALLFPTVYDLMPDHVHMCIEIPPRHAVASVIGYLKGKSAIAIARQFAGRDRNFAGEHFWARGYTVSTVGFELEQVRADIRDQQDADGAGRF